MKELNVFGILGIVKLISEQEECTLTPYLAVFICHSASPGFDFGKPLQQ